MPLFLHRFAAVAVCAAALGFATSANAQPLITSAAPTDKAAPQIIKVGSRRYHRRSSGHYGEYGYVSGKRHVDAPYTNVETSTGRVAVDAPYATVRRSRNSVRVRAPYVNIQIPR